METRATFSQQLAPPEKKSGYITRRKLETNRATHLVYTIQVSATAKKSIMLEQMFPTFSSRREEESSEQPRSHLIGGLFSLERLPDLPHVKHGRHASSDVHLRLYTAHIPHTVKSCRRQRRNTGDDVMTASTTVTTARERRGRRG